LVLNILLIALSKKKIFSQRDKENNENPYKICAKRLKNYSFAKKALFSNECENGEKMCNSSTDP
jgi:hypothetical protein